jgi:peptidoglycan/xylan/chitin deacetylase (PgdA/CDA1 family)
VSLTVDVEQDCPPFLGTWRGIEEGVPLLLDLFEAAGVSGTFFVTGEVARRFPPSVMAIVAAGHELGCHGDVHADFSRLSAEEARRDLQAACDTLRAFAPVTSFRAPYLRFPRAFLHLLEGAGFRVDSSEARYKGFGVRARRDGALTRIPASLTSSLLRCPWPVRRAALARLRDPAVLFVHPWEFVDFRRAPIRWDCRFRTGPRACQDLHSVVEWLRGRGVSFVRLGACAGSL